MIPLLFVHVAFFCIFFHWCHKFLFLFVSLFCFFFFNSTLIFCFFLNIFSTDELNSARIADVIFQDASTYCMRFIKDHKLQRSQGNLNCKPLYLTHWAKGKILQKFKKLCWGLPVAWKLLPKHSYHSISPLPLSVWGGEGGGVTFSPKLWKGRRIRKNECLRGLKGSLPQIFARGAFYIPCQKDPAKWNMVLKAKFLNVNLGLF